MRPFCAASPFASKFFFRTGALPFLTYFYFCSIFLCSSVTSTAISKSSSNSSPYILRNVFEHKDQCYKDSFVYIRDDDKEPQPFLAYTTTKECSERLKQDVLPEIILTCPPGLIDMDLQPVYVPKSQISYPYASLNISVTAHSPVDTIAFRLECLSASDGSDVYCSDSKAMYINGVKEWPCRGLQLSTRVNYPVRFSYACFRLTSFSVYAINATVLPQKCRVSTIVTAPYFDDLFPEVLVDPTVNQSTITKLDPYWAPMLSADFSDDNAIWIHLGKTERAECDKIIVNVYKELEDNPGKNTFLEILSVSCPEKSIKWENQKAGRYLLTAYVPIRGCKFHCDETERGCHQCIRTHLNLIIKENRASLTWLALLTIRDNSFAILISVIAIITVVVIAIIIFVAYLFWKQKAKSLEVTNIHLTDIIKVLLVYTYDNELHMKCVDLLAENLREYATCEPVLDTEQLNSGEMVVPSRWIVEQCCSHKKFIIVISSCAERILDSEDSKTRCLVQARPFADLFEPAINMIIRDATQNMTGARKKYAIARFSYSSQVPANLAILNFPTFTLPEQFGNLTAFLHDVENAEHANITQNIPEDRLADWNRAINRMVKLYKDNPNWIDERWRPKEELASLKFNRKLPVNLPIRTEEDRIAASKKFNLIPPNAEEDSEDDEDGPPKANLRRPLVLYPRSDSDSESSSDS